MKVESVLSAIIIVGPETRTDGEGSALTSGATLRFSPAVTQVRPGTPLVCVDVLGRSVTVRLIDELRRAGVDTISLVGNVSDVFASGIDPAVSVMPCSREDAWRMAKHELNMGKQGSLHAMLVVRAGAYVDIDLRNAVQYHRDQARAVTRVLDKQGPLDMWIVDPARIGEEGEEPDLSVALHGDEPAQYLVSGYVNRLEGPSDLRQLAVDGLTSRCGLRPQGSEIRPGVWMDEGAQIHRDTRIVAPAFIGRGSRIAAQCLITRCTNIESNCHVDYGTVVEDSSILSNSYVGIGLDLSHAIVDGSHLLNLEHNVTLEVADPCIIRQNKVLREETNFRSSVGFALENSPNALAEEGSR
jgi:NDP-sugar pyrophosphorylase family protein